MKTGRVVCILAVATLFLAPLRAQQAPAPRPYRILVTNDDGVRAPTLSMLAQALQAIGDVVIIASSDNQSAKSHSLNTTEPVFREDLTLPSGLRAIGLTATPATAMQVAVKNILNPRPDMVVSGINPGYNLGYSAYLSATVGAARQAAIEGIPAIAVSMAAAAPTSDRVFAAEEALWVARRVKQFGLPAGTFLNVNVPPMPPTGYRGYRVTSAAPMRAGEETFVEMKHPSGRTLYFSSYKEGFAAPEGSDGWAVANGFVAVTPLRLGEAGATIGNALRESFQ